jgi:hypothetical protein
MCTAIAVLICLALFVHAVWYTFVLFMLVAQPLLVLATVLFVWTVLRDLRRKGAL